MEPDTRVNQDNSIVDVSFDIELILSVYTLGGKGRPGRASVPIGRVAVVSHDQEAFDHDSLPEVYLAGETITRSRFRRDAECVVIELAEYPGTVTVNLTQRLAGVSLTDGEMASARFLYHLRTEDPIKLLSREPKWMTSDGAERLKTRVKELVNDELYATLSDSIYLWSHPDIREVSGSIFSRLDRTLKAWGLRLESEVPGYRVYPPLLYEVVLQFKESEIDLLEMEPAEKYLLLERLGLQNADLLKIQNISAQKGLGAGLFSAAKDRKKQIDPFIEWLASEEQMARAAAGFLRGVYSGDHSTQDVELTEQVVLAAFRHPMLGLGEWEDTG